MSAAPVPTLLIPAPKGALAALFIGALCPAPEAGSYRMMTYRARMIDTAKLDGLSPPWMRMGQDGGHASARSRQAADKLAGLLISFASHYAREALRDLRMDSAATLVCGRVEPLRELPGQIGVACGVRIGVDAAERFEKMGLPSPSEAAALWGKSFHAKMSAAMRSKRDVSGEWQGVPSGAPRAAMISVFELGLSDEDAESLIAWSPGDVGRGGAPSVGQAEA